MLIKNAWRIESTKASLWEGDPDSLRAVVSANDLGVALMVNSFAPLLMMNPEAPRRSSRIIDFNSGG